MSVLCHSSKLGMKIIGAKMTVSRGHLDGSMAEDSAQVVQIAPILDEPACECVAQVVPPKVSQVSPLACGAKAILHINKSAAVSLCEQKRAVRPLRLIE